MTIQKSRRKETLQQKVDRLNGYHTNEHDYLFDRLFNPLKETIEQSGKQLVYRGGLYAIEERAAIEARPMQGFAPEFWLDAILQA